MESRYEKAQEEICNDHTGGLLTDKQYREAMRDLDREYDEYAREAAQETYNSFY